MSLVISTPGVGTPDEPTRRDAAQPGHDSERFHRSPGMYQRGGAAPAVLACDLRQNAGHRTAPPRSGSQPCLASLSSKVTESRSIVTPVSDGPVGCKKAMIRCRSRNALGSWLFGTAIPASATT